MIYESLIGTMWTDEEVDKNLSCAPPDPTAEPPNVSAAARSAITLHVPGG